MKKIVITMVYLLFIIAGWAQSPEKMSYQAVIRNSSDELLVNYSVGMQISILQGSADGVEVYVERHFPTTNANGLVSIEIGTGTIISGNFSNIDWSTGIYFFKTETDPNGGANYTITGITQLLSVPYALYAKKAENGFSGDYNDLNNKPSQICDFTLNANSKNINNLANPVNDQDAATKAYVDALIRRIEILENANLLNEGFIDSRDSIHYNVVKIGNQIWMAENLKYLPFIDSSLKGSEVYPYYYVYGYDGSVVAEAKATSNYDTYGVLYNWTAAMNGATSSSLSPSGVQGVCPSGWHLPSDAEWTILSDFLEGESELAYKLKESGTTHWGGTVPEVTNETGFTALPGGYRDYYGTFKEVGYHGIWWCATEISSTLAWRRQMYSSYSSVFRDNFGKSFGYSVRCVKD